MAVPVTGDALFADPNVPKLEPLYGKVSYFRELSQIARPGSNGPDKIPLVMVILHHSTSRHTLHQSYFIEMKLQFYFSWTF